MKVDFFTPLYVHDNLNHDKDSFFCKFFNTVENYFSLGGRCATVEAPYWGSKNKALEHLTAKIDWTPCKVAEPHSAQDWKLARAPLTAWDIVKTLSYATGVIPLLMYVIKTINRHLIPIDLKRPDQSDVLEILLHESRINFHAKGSFFEYIIELDDYGYYRLDLSGNREHCLTKVRNFFGDIDPDRSQDIVISNDRIWELLKIKLSQEGKSEIIPD